MGSFANKNEEKTLKHWLGTGSINIFGKPFSGKDTQAARLAKLFNATTISSGDIIRKSDDAKTKKVMARGQLVPTTAFIDLVLPFLAQDHLKSQPLILSSVGRWQGEEEQVMAFAAKSGHPTKAVICLDIPDNLFYERWEQSQRLNDRGGREDDNAEYLETRLKEFNAKTLPVLEFYKQHNLLITIDGTHDKDTVTNEIITQLLARINT